MAAWAERAPGAHTAVGQWVACWWAALVTLLVGALVAMLATAGAAEVYEQVTEERDGLAALDRPALDWSIAHRPSWLTDAATAVTHTGGGIGLPILGLAVGGLLWWRRRSLVPLAMLVAAGAGSLAMTMVGKAMIGRARPPLADAVPPYEYSSAFPSGHTLNSTTLALVTAYLLLIAAQRRSQRVAIVAGAIAFAFTIGVTRVYLGHHWLTDVVAGWALGAAWAAVVITAHRLSLTVSCHRAAHHHAGAP